MPKNRYIILFVSGWMNKSKGYNVKLFSNLLDSRPHNVPLITVSNHHSCFDDPGIWGNLNKLFNENKTSRYWTTCESHQNWNITVFPQTWKVGEFGFGLRKCLKLSNSHEKLLKIITNPRKCWLPYGAAYFYITYWKPNTCTLHNWE